MSLSDRSVVVLGGGLAGMAAAYTLARRGYRDILVLERAAEPGGLAGSFEHDGHTYPLGYHHILHKDATLLAFLKLIGAVDDVRWRRVRMLFETEDGVCDLANPLAFARLGLSWADKLRFVRLMLRAYATADWSPWEGRSAAELVDAWAGAEVRRQLFEPLCRLKFELPASAVSGAWLGARLHFREGSAPLGYIPDRNWTQVLCSGVASLLGRAGVRIRTGVSVERLQGAGSHLEAAILSTGERIGGDLWVSAIPTSTYTRLVPADRTPHLSSIRYTALLSVVCGAPTIPLPPFYWTNLCSGRTTACAIFRLDSLNPTIGPPGEMCLNFITHLGSASRPLFALSDAELIARYRADFASVFGRPVALSWAHVSRIPAYSPVFTTGFRNPPARSATCDNVFFAGNYRTFPSIASTGTALRSGIEAATAVMRADRTERRTRLDRAA